MASIPLTLTALLLSTTPEHERVCDDGSSPWDENGRPNVDCERNGCAVGEPICWSETLDICYSDAGDDNGSCYLQDKSCDDGVRCWGLYIACVGEWSCDDSYWWGCGRGTCLEPK